MNTQLFVTDVNKNEDYKRALKSWKDLRRTIWQGYYVAIIYDWCVVLITTNLKKNSDGEMTIIISWVMINMQLLKLLSIQVRLMDIHTLAMCIVRCPD